MPKSEMKKYETENRKAPGVKYGKIEKDVKPIERDYNEYEVKPGSSKDSDGPRLKEQTSPSQNPKEEAEGNNKPDGMEPEFEFKDKVAKELAKEKASHMVKSQSGMHTVVYKSAAFEKSEDQTNDLNKAETGHEKGINSSKQFLSPPMKGLKPGESSAGRNVKLGGSANNLAAHQIHQQTLGEMKQMSGKDRSGMGKTESWKKSEKLEKGDWKKIHDKLKREGYSEESANKIDGSIKAKLGKNENPDKEADAELGEKVEHDVEEHMQENAAAEREEGHSMAKPGDKMENPTESAVIPRLIGSAKLSKFMEYRHAKKKAQMAQQAAGQQAQGAPAQGSTQAGQPDAGRPKSQPTDGDVDKMGKK